MKTMQITASDGSGIIYYLPQDENEVIQLVQEAKDNQEIICLRGSAHSFPLINELQLQSSQGKKYKFVMLSELRAVTIDAANKRAHVQAGCNLGRDPYDPTENSNIQNSLLYQLDQAGLALPDLGGITHQTIAGFMANGCSGGTTQHAFDECIYAIEIVQFVNGTAQKVTYTRPSNGELDDPFYGIGVNMGVMGVVTAVTLDCVDRFYIKGKETTSTLAKSAIDILGNGDSTRRNFETFLQQTEYTRMLWWPQEDFNKVVVWQAKQVTKAEAEPLKPYEEAPPILGSSLPATAGADLLFTAIGQWPSWFDGFFGSIPGAGLIRDAIAKLFYPHVLPKLLGLFVSDGVQEFSDIGWKGLPMDNQMNDKLFPVRFTELWIPIQHTHEVMNDLNVFYAQGPQNTLAFATEFYAAKKSDFWLSPGYNADVVRVDVFWFGNNKADIDDYYEKFWKLLAKYNFRPHWGKHLPPHDGLQGTAYLKAQYPKWDEWMKLRDKMDPTGVFLNDYWKSYLGLSLGQST